MKRPKKPAPPPSFHPHACVVLAVDPAAKSGWAVFVNGAYVESGIAMTHVDRLDAAARALVEAARRELPLAVVGEKWPTGGPFGGHRTQSGLSEQWGLWRAALEQTEVPKSRILRVLPSAWWRQIGAYARLGHDEIKLRSRRHAARVIVRPLDEIGEDEADAIGIGAWATRAGEVAAVLPTIRKTKQKAPPAQRASVA